jgi:hypothetical protein
MNLSEVPGIQAIKVALKRIGDVELSSAEYLSSRTVFRFGLNGRGREGVLELSAELLTDLRDNKAAPGTAYARELNNRLEQSLWKVIERAGLTGYTEPSISYLLLQFISEATKKGSAVHKYNTIGRGVIGDFERWTKTTLLADEKETLIWVWNEMLRLRFISSTGTDLVDPDNWVKLTPKGVAAIQGKDAEQGPRTSLLSPNPSNSSPATMQKQSVGTFEYDVAISFASEQRPEAEGIALCLKRAGVRVFYDIYEQSNLWGKNLYDHLAEVYQKKARYCLMLVSAAYAAKVWPNHERQNAQARALSEKDEYILPVRFDNTEIPGLPQTVGYLQFQDHHVQGVCKLILEKLGVSSPVTASAAPKPLILPDPPEYQTQRKQLPSTGIFQKIFTKPRWHVLIRPAEFKTARFRNLQQCQYFMKSEFVPAGRGMHSYPFVSDGDVNEKDSDWIAEEIEGRNELERWNLFRSGQFVHYRAIDDKHFSGHIHVLEILDTVTQAFEFAARLARQVSLQGIMAITIDLQDVDGLALMWPADNFGLQNLAPSNCWSQDKHLNATRTIVVGELTARKRELALDVVIEIFSQFSWPAAPRDKFDALQSERFASVD